MTGSRWLSGAVRRVAGALESLRAAVDSVPLRRVPPSRQRTPRRPESRTHGSGYPGDYTGVPETSYSPTADGAADPGEVVWAWVPFEEDHRRGKTRPVLVIGRDAEWLIGLPLTSKDHDRDAAQEAHVGRHWIDIGSGDWDRRRRPSEARVDRIVRLHPTQTERGARLDEQVFARVIEAVRLHRS